MGDELLWAVKNGDLSTIRQHIDKVSCTPRVTHRYGEDVWVWWCGWVSVCVSVSE